MPIRSLLLLLLVTTLPAQTDKTVSLSAGFKLGAPIDSPSNQNRPYSTITDGRWTAGPSLELKLPYRLAVEIDALYRTRLFTNNFTFRTDAATTAYQFQGSTNTNAWDFPLLLKRRFQLGSAKPFVSVGYQWSHLSDTTTGTYFCPGPQGSCRAPGATFEPGFYRVNSSFLQRSVVAGAGLEFNTRYVTIAPEVRWSRNVNGAPKENRVTGLVGFTFGGK